MPRYTLPRDLYFGSGAVKELKHLKGNRAFVVAGGQSATEYKFLESVVQYLQEAGMAVESFTGVEPDPSVETVQAGAKQMLAFAPDWIIAVGGGSPIDAAKAMWVFYEYPNTKFEDLIEPFGFPALRQKARFAAIPTTSGTGTEVTAFSVITDYQNGIKYPLADYEITPDVAILDPDFAATMPQQLVANTGMDALTHAIEAYVSTAANPFTDPLALRAIAMIFRYLKPSYDGDQKAREQMHYAQCLAGMAFTNALLGAVHAMAHKTGAVFENGHITHGAANAMFLPKVIRYNAREPRAAKRYVKIAKIAGLSAESEMDFIDLLIKHIEELNEYFGIAKSMKQYGGGIIPEHEFKEKLPGIVKLAMQDACIGTNPRKVNKDEMEKLFLACYYDLAVDF